MPSPCRKFASLLVALLLVGCGGSDEDQIRSAFQKIQDAAVGRDYPAMWAGMSSASRSALAKQLQDFQSVAPGSPRYAEAESALGNIGLSVAQIRNMTTPEFFVATFEGLDRVRPEMRKQQVEESKSRSIVKLEVLGDRAEMTTRTASGNEEKFSYVRETTGWKIEATSVGKGLD